MKRTGPLWRWLSVVLAVCLSCTLLSACKTGGLHAYSATYMDETFDTVLTITVGAADHKQATDHCSAIKVLVSDLHRQFDAYKTYEGINNIAVINASPHTPVEVSHDLLSLCSLGQEIYDQTDGAVHIGLGTVTRLWKEAMTTSTLPAPASVEQALACSRDLQGLVVDKEAGTVTITTEGMKLDVGAIAKGYVLEKIRAYAESAGLSSLLCNLGGEILAIGSSPGGRAWEVAVADPDGGTLKTLHVRDVTLASGGDYERFCMIDGTRFHHIIDPSTGYPATTHRAATVILPLSYAAYADAYSTALLILPSEQGERLLADVSGGEALWVLPDHTVVTTKGWNAHMS